jgi:hypothetical protein
MHSNVLLLVAFTTGLASAQVTPPTEAKTEPLEYFHEGDALLGHLSIPQDGEGPYPGTYSPLISYYRAFLMDRVAFPCSQARFNFNFDLY